MNRSLRLFVLGSFLFTNFSFAAIQLSLRVVPESSEDSHEAMECELSLSRGRQNPLATLEGIKSNLVFVETQAKGYRVRGEESVYEENRHTSELPLDYDHFVKQVAKVAEAKVVGDRNGGPVGPRLVYSGKLDGKRFILSEVSERGMVNNTSEEADHLEDILRRACYK